MAIFASGEGESAAGGSSGGIDLLLLSSTGQCTTSLQSTFSSIMFIWSAGMSSAAATILSLVTVSWLP